MRCVPPRYPVRRLSCSTNARVAAPERLSAAGLRATTPRTFERPGLPKFIEIRINFRAAPSTDARRCGGNEGRTRTPTQLAKTRESQNGNRRPRTSRHYPPPADFPRTPVMFDRKRLGSINHTCFIEYLPICNVGLARHRGGPESHSDRK